jgi:hypothetical protein
MASLERGGIDQILGGLQPSHLRWAFRNKGRNKNLPGRALHLCFRNPAVRVIAFRPRPSLTKNIPNNLGVAVSIPFGLCPSSLHVEPGQKFQ